MKTKYKSLFAPLFFLLTFPSFATEEKCDCSTAFEDLIEKIEANYVYLAQLRLDGNANMYDSHIGIYSKMAKTTESQDCTKLLKDFTRFFDDGHLFVTENPKYNKEELENFKKDIKSKKKSVESILKALKFEKSIKENNRLDGIIGKWTDGFSEFAVIKDEGYYRAYVLSSTIEHIEAGELKAEFKEVVNGFEGQIYSNDYEPMYIEGNLYKEATLLNIVGATVWGKLESSKKREIGMINHKDILQPKISKLDEKTTLFSIPSFSYDYNKFIKIVLDNEELLKNTENLIFDIRGNTGGNAVYMAFIDMYANKTLPSSQGTVLASQATLLYYQRFMSFSAEVYEPVVNRIKENIGKIIDGPLFPEKTFKPYESKIQNVAILTDNACASAAESFVLHSKLVSTKVKTFGSATHGMIDYASVNVLSLESGDQNISFGYPTETWHKEVISENAYNKTGLIPDVPINPTLDDKVLFIVNYYDKKY
jgi:hypothetical protein